MIGPVKNPPPDRLKTPAECGCGPIAQWLDINYSEGEALCHALAKYTDHVIVPRVLAERRRKAGDSRVSPKDYACMCPVSPKDNLPICHSYKKTCRFQHRPKPPGPYNCNNGVRHDLFKQEYSKLMKQWESGKREEFIPVAIKAMIWYKQWQRKTRARYEREYRERQAKLSGETHAPLENPRFRVNFGHEQTRHLDP